MRRPVASDLLTANGSETAPSLSLRWTARAIAAKNCTGTGTEGTGQIKHGGPSAGDGEAARAVQAGIVLGFTAGARPDRTAISGALAAGARGMVSHAPQAPGDGVSAKGHEGDWLELLCDGLTYDCLGLEPGPGLIEPAFRHHLGIAPRDAAAPADQYIGLYAGPHIEAAAASLPVVRSQALLARDLVEWLPGIASVGWTPAGLRIAPNLFREAIDAWLGGNAFPALALVGFARGGDGSVSTEGLGFFTGQEMWIAPDAASGPVAALQLAARLVHELVAAQPLAEAQHFVAPDGVRLIVRPREGSRMLDVVRA